jgi:hypothetical protein
VTATTDTVIADSNANAIVRLSISGGTGVDEVDLSFAGASLAAVPLNAAVTQPANPTDPVVLLKVATGGAPPAPVVVDVSLKGLAATRVVTIIATGKKSGKSVPGAVTEVALPVVAGSAPKAGGPASSQ